MTSREARLANPKLLPGPSAAAWSRVINWLWVVSGVVFVASLIFEFVGSLKHVLPFPGFTLVIPAIAITVVLRLVLLAGIPREKAEARAGYTTLERKYPALEQLDPGTGAILRAAGEPYLPRKRSRSHPSADAANSPTPVTRPSVLRRLAPTLIGSVGAAILILVVYGVSGLLSQGRLTAILVVVPAVVVVYAIAIAIGSAGVRRILLRLKAAAPGEFAFIFGTSNGLVSALQALVPVEETADADLTRSRQATASAAGITFWQGNPLHKTAILPWSKVMSIQQDLVQVGRSSNPSVVITFRDEEAEEVVALPLMNAEANYFALHSVAEARWIASELNQLRTAKTSARLI